MERKGLDIHRPAHGIGEIHLDTLRPRTSELVHRKGVEPEVKNGYVVYRADERVVEQDLFIETIQTPPQPPISSGEKAFNGGMKLVRARTSGGQITDYSLVLKHVLLSGLPSRDFGIPGTPGFDEEKIVYFAAVASFGQVFEPECIMNPKEIELKVRGREVFSKELKEPVRFAKKGVLNEDGFEIEIGGGFSQSPLSIFDVKFVLGIEFSISDLEFLQEVTTHYVFSGITDEATFRGKLNPFYRVEVTRRQ